MTITPLPCSLWLDVGSMLWSQPLNVMLSCHCNEGWREVPVLSTCLMPDGQPLTAAILALLVEVPDLGSELHPLNMFVTFALLHCTRWRHQKEHFPRKWPFVRGVQWSPVDSPHMGPMTRRFDVFFDLRLNKRLSKQWRRRWFETPSPSLWRHCNDFDENEIDFCCLY